MIGGIDYSRYPSYVADRYFHTLIELNYSIRKWARYFDE